MNYFDHKLAKTTAIYGFLTLIIAILSYNFLDIKFATLVHSSELFGTGISTIAAFTSNIFSPKVWTVITAIATVICIYKHIVKKPSQKLYIMSLSLIMTIIITTIVKVILARYRPEMLLFDNHYGFHFFSFKKAYNSMPSGHTALTFAGLLAIANFFEKKYITLIAIIISGLVAVSRIIILDHFISDVIVAAYIGIFTYLWSKVFVESK
ncbi:phosphatase PAP2 family protein [Francisella tularensis]|uniref:undecaprenyl-diphosphate phosphatase n=2 Tax=Francisella tularensis subsp. holarctica TaxID=119857 RepID=A0AAI8BGF5_FRATH|nr:phosphatase PAP2 family protein [Francisella tularensis]AFX71344.1 PAP2 family protein [Francisella tularensis subsp. holarctica F92]EBA53155.1 PAP2 family protein [Francisella tularensis subsp. holarctica 257]ABI83443.1 PAP2 family protein [Francisella tularensis subsp. holarctica OSU18]ABU62306.1 phosphatidic acid phosphatase (PAP2) family protein [Francisella tularensis subsp. holarctica FTNF002-00]AFT93317.1 acid phosphatase [Francisella tularensis subsp. holarctica FSC200]